MEQPPAAAFRPPQVAVVSRNLTTNSWVYKASTRELPNLPLEDALLVVGVRHLSEKEAKAGLIAAILGSSAWVQVPRAVVAVASDNDDPNISHVQVVVGNRLPAGSSGRAFRIEGVQLEGLEESVTRAAWIGDSTKDVEELIGQGRKEPSKSASALELILDLLEDAPGQRIESDELDAQVARATGLAVKTVRNLRTKLKDEGLIRSEPQKGTDGTVERWLIVRMEAARPVAATGSGQPDPDVQRRGVELGSTTPHPVQIPTQHTTGPGLVERRLSTPDPESVSTGCGDPPHRQDDGAPDSVDEDEIDRLAELALRYQDEGRNE